MINIKHFKIVNQKIICEICDSEAKVTEKKIGTNGKEIKTVCKRCKNIYIDIEVIKEVKRVSLTYLKEGA